MSRRSRSEEPWMGAVAEGIVREGLTIRESLSKVGVALTSQEAENCYRSKTFQRILRDERNRYFTELGSDPARTKSTAIGMLLDAAEHLREAGEYKEVAEAMLKLGKMEGWIGGEGAVNVFAGLTQRELDEVRNRLRKQDNPSSGKSSTPLN